MIAVVVLHVHVSPTRQLTAACKHYQHDAHESISDVSHVVLRCEDIYANAVGEGHDGAGDSTPVLGDILGLIQSRS